MIPTVVYQALMISRRQVKLTLREPGKPCENFVLECSVSIGEIIVNLQANFSLLSQLLHNFSKLFCLQDDGISKSHNAVRQSLIVHVVQRQLIPPVSPNLAPVFIGDWVVLCHVGISVRRSRFMFCLEIVNHFYFSYTCLKFVGNIGIILKWYYWYYF